MYQTNTHIVPYLFLLLLLLLLCFFYTVSFWSKAAAAASWTCSWHTIAEKCFVRMLDAAARFERQSLQAALPYVHAAVARLADSLAESCSATTLLGISCSFCSNAFQLFSSVSACVGLPCDCLANIFLISWQCLPEKLGNFTFHSSTHLSASSCFFFARFFFVVRLTNCQV